MKCLTQILLKQKSNSKLISFDCINSEKNLTMYSINHVKCIFKLIISIKNVFRVKNFSFTIILQKFEQLYTQVNYKATYTQV